MGFLKLNVQFFFVCFELTWVGGERWGFEGWGFEGWGAQPRKSGAPKGAPKGGGSKGGVRKGAEPRKNGAPKGGGPKGGGPKISRFFCSLPPEISFFLLSLGVFSWNFGGVLKTGTLKCARLEFSGCRVKPRRPRSRRGFTPQPESPNVHI